MNRRTFLKAGGVCITLSGFEAFADKKSENIRRFVAMSNPLGMYAPTFFPKGAGKNYEYPAAIKPLEKHRGNLTIFKNLDHGISGGHKAQPAFLSGLKLKTAYDAPEIHKEKNISLDQKFANYIGHKTRFRSLTVSPETYSDFTQDKNSVSWTHNGIRVPIITDPLMLFNKLFKQDSIQALKKKARDYNLEKSILDTVLQQSKVFNAKLSRFDKEKMDQFFTSIREVELKIHNQSQWITKKKPQIQYERGLNGTQLEKVEIFFDLLHLALVTDSTRSLVFQFPYGVDLQPLEINKGYHQLSHHGKKTETLKDLLKIESFWMKCLSGFLTKLVDSQLLDSTTVLFGSGLSDASAHKNNCLPIIVAGGGFKHGEHKIYPSEKSRKVPLNNLYLTLLQAMGMEVDSFHTSTGTLNGFS